MVWERIRSDDDFVRSLKLEALRETLTLKYQSYILALAIGASMPPDSTMRSVISLRSRPSAFSSSSLPSPIRFASNPERNFFEQILEELNLTSVDVEDFYFTGGLTDPAKTDFYVEYRDDKGKPRRYTPDFLIRKRAARGKPRGSGKVFIVEIKSEDKRDHKIDGASGAKAMELLRPDFGPDSDVDFLATFEHGAGWTLFDEITMQDELAQIVGRRVDLASRRAIERSHNWIRRRSILEGAEAVHGS